MEGEDERPEAITNCSKYTHYTNRSLLLDFWIDRG